MRRSCPVCNFIGPHRILHRQRFLDGPLGAGYNVAICTRCGAGFADGIPSQNTLDRYYTKRSKYEYAQSGGAESPYDFRRFEAIVKQVVPFVHDKDATVLDVGCATGGLLASLRKHGYTRLLGSDPSIGCSNAARRLHDIEVLPLRIQELEKLKPRFDLILMVGVLEHLREVRSAIAIVANLLKPGGLIYCAQPDVQAFADCVNAPYQQFSTEHVNFFSKSSMLRLMSSHGLKTQKTWRWMVEWRKGVHDSVISGIFGKEKSESRRAKRRRDQTTSVSLLRYLEMSRRADTGILRNIEKLIKSQEPLLVWGAGTLTRRLLAESKLREANIVAFVDASPYARIGKLAGRIVIAPEQTVGRTETILIMSKAFQVEITQTIRKRLKLHNKVRRIF